MAGRLLRCVAFSIPAIVVIVSIYWLRRRRKLSRKSLTELACNRPENLIDDISSTGKVCVAEQRSPHFSRESVTVDQVNMRLKGKNCNENSVDNVIEEDLTGKCCKVQNQTDSPLKCKKETIYVGEGDDSQPFLDEKLSICSDKMTSIENYINEENEAKANVDSHYVDSKNDSNMLRKSADILEEDLPTTMPDGGLPDGDLSAQFCNEKIVAKQSNNLYESRSPGLNSDSLFSNMSSINSPRNSTCSDAHSEGSSSDSGIQGAGSDINVGLTEINASGENSVIIFQFELPQQLCGRLIGKQGSFVNSIKDKCNATVIINRHPYSPHIKLCSIEGTRSEIKNALHMIRNRFPFREYPDVTLHQINAISPATTVPVPLRHSCQLPLPEGVWCDVILSSLVNAGHFFLQQPTHPTYPSLSRLDQFMYATYSQIDTPPIPKPTAGIVCAVSMRGWYRATVVDVSESNECCVKFVDYGGYSRVPASSLRQIRFDFMTLPFQASECYLANVKPANGADWSTEANLKFEELAQGQILQANIVKYSNGIPCLHVYRIQGVSNIFINKELVNSGHAVWVD